MIDPIPKGYYPQMIVHIWTGYSTLTQCELVLVEKGHSELDVKPDTGKGLFEEIAFKHVTLSVRQLLINLKA